MPRRVRGKAMMPRVHRVTRHGEIYKYHRVTRKPLPNDVPEDHIRFTSAWAIEEAKGHPGPRKKAIKGSIVSACQDYLASKDFHDLSDGYRPVIRRHVDAIRTQAEDAAGVPMARDLRASDIQSDLGPLSPAVAASRLKAWRKLCGYWASHGMISDDVSSGVARKPIPATHGHREWTQKDVDTFREFWPLGSAQRLTFELLQWTGARCSDVVRLGPQMIDGQGLLTYTQTKTRREAIVPWSAPAFGLEAQRGDLLQLTSKIEALVFLRTKFGKPRSPKSMSQWFSAAATDAGLADLSAHGLRKYRMNQLAEAGASVLGMQAWVGHVTLDEVQHYTRRAERRNVYFVNPSEVLQNGADK